MIDASFPEPNNTSLKKEVGRLGSLGAWILKDQRDKAKGKRGKDKGNQAGKPVGWEGEARKL